MKLVNYPLTILLLFGLFAIGCESARRNNLNAPEKEVAVSVAADTADMAFFQQDLSEAQLDSVWRSKGY